MNPRVPRFRFIPGKKGACLTFCTIAGLPWAFGQSSQSPALPAQGGQEVNWAMVGEQYSQRFLEATPAVEVSGLVMPWENARAIVVAIPLADWYRKPDQSRTIRDLLAALLPRVTVVGVYREIDYRLVGDWLGAMERDAEIAPHLKNLELVGSEVFSIWSRDFSPVFARGVDGGTVLIDPSFLAARRMMGLLQEARSQPDPTNQHLALIEATRELKGMQGTDIFPSALGAFMESRLGYDVALTRPPLYLLGGDFLIVDAGAALVSSITLEENGGRASHVSEVFEKYFGVEKVLFLENLPGDTIEHLDFIVQPVAPGVILAATPPESFGSSRPYHRYLNQELSRRLVNNRERLVKAFPKARIIDVPMPPPLLDDDDDVVRELIFRCVEQIAAKSGLSFWSAGGQDALSLENMDPRLEAVVQREFGVADWRNPARQRAAVEKYLGRPAAELISRHVEEHVRYRSYINSLYLRTGGTELVLVPRYRAANSEESALIARMESEVRAAYREALPNAEFRWIDCTSLVDLLGAVHCLTATIPESKN